MSSDVCDVSGFEVDSGVWSELGKRFDDDLKWLQDKISLDFHLKVGGGWKLHHILKF